MKRFCKDARSSTTMMKRTRGYIFALFMLMLVAAACNTSGCLDNQSSLPLAGFYSASSKSKVTLDSISVYAVGVPGDSMMVKCGTSVSQVYMPFDLENSSVRYVLHYDQKAISDERLNDTITINYDVVPYFVSDECGAMCFFDIKNYTWTRHIVDSVAFASDRITNVNVENIKIYVRTAANN